MIKLLILLSLLPPVNAHNYITRSMCDEMFDVLYEHVEEGRITNKEAEDIFQRCLDLAP